MGGYSAIDNCVGALIYGEIPFAFVSRIIFENDDNKTMFRRSSPDLWYPVDMFCTWSALDKTEIEVINNETMLQIIHRAECSISDSRKELLNQYVRSDLKIKAAGYYAVEATRGWLTESVKANIDYSLADALTMEGEEEKLNTFISNAICKLPQANELGLVDCFVSKRDEIFDGTGDSLNAKLFALIGEALAFYDYKDTGNDLFDALARICANGCPEEKIVDVSKALMTVKQYLESSTMNPKVALADISKFPVFQAMMLFIDNKNNTSHIRNACRILGQEARRYAYVFFALYNGMDSVSGKEKQNTALENQLEAVTLSDNCAKELIRAVPKHECLVRDGLLYGIPVGFDVYYSEKASYKMVMEKASDETLQELYALMQSSIPSERVKLFENPIYITVKVADKEQQISVSTIEDLYMAKYLIDRVLDEKTMKADMGLFRNTLKEEGFFKELYNKYSEKLQSIFRRI